MPAPFHRINPNILLHALYISNRINNLQHMKEVLLLGIEDYGKMGRITCHDGISRITGFTLRLMTRSCDFDSKALIGPIMLPSQNLT